ncbi:hypothetical protein ACFY5A_00270 [Microbacterium sp. NPDC012755]|uniref:hypothetical protein n=1 Tax=Microbacterium sp. NPDC012755 TaxID=3364184 RepID=UPI0036CDED8C
MLQRTRAAQLLSADLDLEVVHTSSSLILFMGWLRRSDRTRWPHLLIMDVPSDADFVREATVIAALRDAGMRVLILSPLRNRGTARQLLDDGIDAMVSTTDSEEDFLLAAESAMNGEMLVTALAQAAVHSAAPALKLSSQEERALSLYATGLTIAEVAERIGVRHDTARKYLKRVRDKFTSAGVPARTKLELAKIAWAEGYVATDTVRVVPPPRTKARDADLA